MKALLGALLVITSCSASEPTSEYGDETQAGFIAACADPVADSSLVAEVCGCFYDELEGTLAFDQLLSIEKERATATENGLQVTLPRALREVLASCIIENSELG